MKIWAHTLVCNEERYIWFAVMGVIDFLDKILIWDTGSTDSTLKIIKEIKMVKGEKVEIKSLGKVDEIEFTKVRQQMLENTKSDWFMILDGDEVWWKDSIRETTEFIHKRGKDFDSVVSKFYNVVGDIYHCQEEKAGKYEIDDQKGHINIRFINKNIKGLHFDKPHGQQGLYDEKNNLIQNLNPKKRLHTENYGYMHFTNMIRSYSAKEDQKVIKRKTKFKYEIGKSFPKDFYYPEVFFQYKPYIVLSPWQRMDRKYFYKALLQTPIRKLKRRLVRGKSGY